MSIAAPKDRRFRRVRATPSRKRVGKPSRRALAWLMVIASVIVLGTYRAADIALAAEGVRVTRITVSGNSRMSRGEVLALLEGLQGASMVTVDLDQWRQTLLGSPWVADAALRRVFPGTIAVAISERDPMAIGRLGDRLYLIDHRGTIIDEFGPNYADFDLPIVDGLASAKAGTALIDEGRSALAGRLLAELRRHPAMAKRISQIDVTDVRDAVVILDGDTTLLRVGDQRFAERLQSYLDLGPALRERVPDIDYVDLRFDERVYVRPQVADKKRQGQRGSD